MMILTINREILIKIMNSGGDYKLLDVRDSECYNQEHIKGAVSLPYENIDNNMEYLNKNDVIIIYSRDIFCSRSMDAAIKLESKDYFNVYVYREGIEDYKKNYLPLEVIFLPDMREKIY
jgi:rhodanese-related sulfurtransferase